MLSGTSASKVGTIAYENLSLGVWFFVQNEVRGLARAAVSSEIVKEGIGKACSLQRLQKLLWNDHVRVNIFDMQGRRNALDNSKFRDT